MSAHAQRTTGAPLLQPPPATVVSPPSPIEPGTSYFPDTSSAASPPSSPPASVQYDSPEDDDEPEPTDAARTPAPPAPKAPAHSPAPRQPSDNSGANPFGRPGAGFVASPRETLLHPRSPPLASTSASPSASPALSRLPSRYMSPRSPSPSSPHYHPRGLGHRRESSTHVVRETTYGEQSKTEDGERMVNQYKIGKSLGKGAYARVELAVDVGTGQEYAVKEFSKSRLHHQALAEKQQAMKRQRSRRSRPPPRGSPSQPGDDGKRKAGPGGAAGLGDAAVIDDKDERAREEDPLGLIRREVAVMKKLDHPNIIRLYEAISVPDADALFLVLEYLPGGTLMHVEPGDTETRAAPFAPEQTREYFRQLCLGLEYLHENGVIHRDIKPDNVLLSEDREVVKLCDFGVSEMFVAAGDDRIKKSGGSPAFLSPESFTTSTSEVHGRAVDIWALGVTLFCMIAGKLPFNVHDPISLFRVVREEDPVLPDAWDADLRDLVHRMLDKDPETRIVMADIRDHPWVTAHGAEPMITTEENLYDVGKKVEEPTQEELGNAISTIRGVFTVVRAVQKMRRLRLHRRSVSAQSNQSASESSTAPALPSPPAPSQQPGPFLSSSYSMASGSMDSYATVASRPSDASTGCSTPPAPLSRAASPTGELCESPGTAGPDSFDLRVDTGGEAAGQARAGEADEADGSGFVDSPVDELDDERDDAVELVDSPVDGDVPLVDSPVDEEHTL